MMPLTGACSRMRGLRHKMRSPVTLGRTPSWRRKAVRNAQVLEWTVEGGGARPTTVSIHSAVARRGSRLRTQSRIGGWRGTPRTRRGGGVLTSYVPPSDDAGRRVRAFPRRDALSLVNRCALRGIILTRIFPRELPFRAREASESRGIH